VIFSFFYKKGKTIDKMYHTYTSYFEKLRDYMKLAVSFQINMKQEKIGMQEICKIRSKLYVLSSKILKQVFGWLLENTIYRTQQYKGHSKKRRCTHFITHACNIYEQKIMTQDGRFAKIFWKKWIEIRDFLPAWYLAMNRYSHKKGFLIHTICIIGVKKISE